MLWLMMYCQEAVTFTLRLLMMSMVLTLVDAIHIVDFDVVDVFEFVDIVGVIDVGVIDVIDIVGAVGVWLFLNLDYSITICSFRRNSAILLNSMASCISLMLR